MSNANDFRGWAASLDGNEINLWREAMAQLRQLHGDVWNGVRFFLTVNGIIIAAVFGIARLEESDIPSGVLLAVLAILGFLITLVARIILAKHRDYYLGILLRKTIIERELGFYDQKICCVDLVFPWKVDKQFVGSLVDNPSAWLADQKRRKGTITRLLFLVYEGVLVIHGIILLAVLIGFCLKYFH